MPERLPLRHSPRRYSALLAMSPEPSADGPVSHHQEHMVVDDHPCASRLAGIRTLPGDGGRSISWVGLGLAVTRGSSRKHLDRHECMRNYVIYDDT